MRHAKLQLVTPENATIPVMRQANLRFRAPDDDEDDSLLLAVLRRRWKLLTFCSLLSLGAAVYAYIYHSLPKSITEAKLMYRSLPPSRGQDINDPFQPLTVADILMSNQVLLNLIHHQNLGISPRRFKKFFEVEASRYNNIISIKFDWNDGQQGIDIVNELMRLCIDQVVLTRKEYLSQYRRDEERALEEAQAKIDDQEKEVTRLRKQLNDQLQQAGKTDSRQAILVHEISGTRQKVDDAHAERNGLISQIDALRSEIAGIERQLKVEALKGKRAQLLHRKRIARDGTPRMTNLEQQIGKFEAENAELEYEAWKAKLDALGKDLLAYYENPAAASVAVLEGRRTSKQNSLDDLQLRLAPCKDKIDLLSRRLESAQNELSQFIDNGSIVSTQLEEAEQALTDLREHRTELARQKTHFKRLETSDFEELEVQTPASWDTTEVYDGKKKLFVLVFAGCWIGLALPVFAIEHFFPSGDPAELAAHRVGLPLLGRGTFVIDRLSHDRVNYHPVNSESLRLLALRIQQSVSGPGAMVLFSGLNHEISSIPTLSYLAECLARREERVLIIDACDRPAASKRSRDPRKDPALVKPRNNVPAIDDLSPSEGGKEEHAGRRLVESAQRQPDCLPLGLSDFLHRNDLQAKDLFCSTDIPGVDMITAGSQAFPCEIFSSAKITRLLEECRHEYTLILVSGPSTCHPSDLQMLSSRADAILLTVPKNARRSEQGDEVVRELVSLGAPVIGIVG
jgi:hypothetical protein